MVNTAAAAAEFVLLAKRFPFRSVACDRGLDFQF